MGYSEAELLAVKQKHGGWLAEQSGVTGVGIGVDQSGQMCLKIYTAGMSSETKQAIAANLDDIPFEFEETGEFRAL